MAVFVIVIGCITAFCAYRQTNNHGALGTPGWHCFRSGVCQRVPANSN